MNNRKLLNYGGPNTDTPSFILGQISYKFEDSYQLHLDAGWDYRLLSRHVQTIHVHKRVGVLEGYETHDYCHHQRYPQKAQSIYSNDLDYRCSLVLV